PPALLGALDEAVATAANDPARYATHRLLLRGQSGEVAATDSRQLLLHGGFTFGWAEDLLVPAVPVFGGRELGPDAPVGVGRTAEHVAVRAGPWTFVLRIDADGRFPAVDAVVPRPQDAAAHGRLAPADL